MFRAAKKTKNSSPLPKGAGEADMATSKVVEELISKVVTIPPASQCDIVYLHKRGSGTTAEFSTHALKIKKIKQLKDDNTKTHSSHAHDSILTR